METFLCEHCAAEFRRFHKLMNHFELEHGRDPHLKLRCMIDGCLYASSNVKSLRSHLHRKHKGKLENYCELPSESTDSMVHNVATASATLNNDLPTIETDCSNPSFNEPSVNRGKLEMDCELPSESNDSMVHNVATAPATSNNDSPTIETDCSNPSSDERTNEPYVDYERFLVKCIIKMKHKYNVPDKAIEQIIQDYSFMLELCKEKTLEATEKSKDIMEPLNLLLNAHKTIDTVYKFKQKCKSEGHVEPIEIPLRNGEKVVYVPILDTIRSLLSHDDVLAEVLKEPSKKNGSIASYSDSTSYSDNALFQESSRALRIKLYTDEFQVVNPLGNKARKHKICAFYFTLDNIPIEFHSKVYTIQLAVLCRSQVVKNLGFDEILTRLVDDLKILETDGVTVRGATGFITLRGSVSVVIADNLGAHDIGGYLTSFVSVRSCRFCDATKDTRTQDFDEGSFIIASKESYDAKVELVAKDPNLSTCYGLKKSSTLNNLQYYHVATGLPSDVAHDIFEGFNIDLLKNLIKHCLKEKHFSLDMLNATIQNFPYVGADRTNKPGLIYGLASSEVQIKQTASQSLCLVRLLPLMIGQHVPSNDVQWILFLRFLRCLDYILAPKLNKGEIQVMREEITSFLTDFFDTNKHLPVKPKAHFLIHYAMQYEMFGPLVNNMTLRYESKHCYMKSTMVNNKNYRNVCLSIAQQHQYHQAYQHMSNEYLPSGSPSFTKMCAAPKFNDQEVCAIKEVISVPTSVKYSRSVTAHGITYSTNHCVLVRFDSEFVFAKVNYCTMYNGSVYLLTNTLETLHYENHLNAFALRGSSRYELVKSDDLLSVFSLPLYDADDSTNAHYLTVMKHFVQV